MNGSVDFMKVVETTVSTMGPRGPSLVEMSSMITEIYLKFHIKINIPEILGYFL